MSGYELGQRVRFITHLRRRYVEHSGNSMQWGKEWNAEAYPGTLNAGGEGIIIGKRTLVNGLNQYNGYDEPITFLPKERVSAYLVAFDLRRKPVHVLPEHLTALDQ